FRPEQKGEGFSGAALQELFEGVFTPIELVKVLALERSPFRRIVAEPLAKLVARGNILDPAVEPRGLFGQTARPDPVHQNPRPILGGSGFVDALHSYFEPTFASHDQGAHPARRGQSANGRTRRLPASPRRPRWPPSAP